MSDKARILITGVGGYIGSVSAYLFLQKGYEVVGIDNFSTGYKQPLELLQKKFGKDKFRFYQVDLRKGFAPDIKKFDFDIVVHYAASCLVDESMKDPAKYFENNVYGSLNLLKTMEKFQVKKIIFSSTCAVYGEGQYFPIDEKHPLDPSSPYGVSKKMVEEIISWYGKLKDFNYVILRYFNVCGASDDGLIGDSKKPSSLLVQNAVRGVLGIEPFHLTCPTVKTDDKTPIRDYINVVDLNLAHLKAVEYLLKGGKSEIINLGTGRGNSVLEIVKKVEEISGKKINRQTAKPRQGEYAKMIASIEKADSVLDWKPKRKLEDSVKSLVNWYSRHPHGWDH